MSARRELELTTLWCPRQFECTWLRTMSGVCRPETRAYQVAGDTFALKRGKNPFAAVAGWDAAGAKSFGYLIFWVNRLGNSA